MLKTSFSLLLLIAFLIVGCAQNTPAPADVVGKAVDEVGNQLKMKRMELQEELNRLEVSFLIDGVRDEKHHEELFLKVKALQDTGTENFTTYDHGGGCYYEGDRFFRISPITDIEARAARVDFGRVLAVDPIARIIMVDASAEPASPPETGWPGAAVINQYVLRRTVNFVAEHARETLVKEFGHDKVVLVWMPSIEVRPNTFSHPPEIVKKLRALAPKTAVSGWPRYGPRNAHLTRATVAPVASVNEVLNALEDESVLIVDEGRRVILLGDVSALKPAPAKSGVSLRLPPLESRKSTTNHTSSTGI